jgi:hypothetical protein
VTPELEKEIIIAIFTAFCTGIPAGLLFWWTRRRDQEHLLVQKVFYNMSHPDSDKDEVSKGTGILIRNRSLFSVRIASVKFLIDGKPIPLEGPLIRANVNRNESPESHFNDCDTWELASQASGRVAIGPNDRVRFSVAVLNAPHKESPEEDFLTSPRVVAFVETESGKEFTSMGVAEKIKHAYNGMPRILVATIILAVFLFAWLIWPTLYFYRDYDGYLVRFNRISGSVAKLTNSGWEHMKSYVTPESSDAIKTVPLDQLRPASSPASVDLSDGFVPRPEYIHPCPEAQYNSDFPSPQGYAASQCVSMLAPNRKVSVEIQVNNEQRAREIGFVIVPINPKK